MTNQMEGFLGKLEVTDEIVGQLDKQLTQAEDQVQQFQGGAAALRAGAAKVSELGAHVDKDLEEGKLSFESEIAAATYVKNYLRRAGEILLNLAERSKAEEMVAHGRVVGLRETMEVVKRHYFVAKTRLEQLLAAAKEASAETAAHQARCPGQHPGPSALDERRAERDNALAEVPVASVPEGKPGRKAQGKKAK